MKKLIYSMAFILMAGGMLFLPACQSFHLPSGPQDPTVTPTPTLVVTTRTFTPTPTATSGGSVTCGSLGVDPSSAAVSIGLLSLPTDNYSAAIYDITDGNCGAVFSQITVYFSNSSSSASSAELAVYDNADRILVASTSIPGSFTGWQTVSITPFTAICGHTIALAVHATGPNLALGQNGDGSTCWYDSGNEPNPMPATYPHPTALTAITSGPCLEMGLAGNCTH